MRLRLLLVLALSAATFAAVPARALPGDSTVTVTGSRAAWVDVTFRTPFTPMFAWVDEKRPVVATRGAYGGVWLEPLGDSRAGRGFVMSRALHWHTRGDWVVSLSPGTTPMPPGRYRLHLLTEAATEVRFTVRGLLAPMRLRPTAKAVSRGQVVDLRTVPAATSGSRTLGIVVGRRTVVVLVAWVNGTTNGFAASVCVADPSTPPCPAGGLPAGNSVSGGRRGGMEFFVPPGGVATGERDVDYVLAAAGPVDSLVALALTFDLT